MTDSSGTNMNENNASQPELLSKQRASDAAQAVAWMHEEDETRVISAQQKAQAERDGGAYASSLRPYTIALGRLPLPQASVGAAGGEEAGTLKSATSLDHLGADRTAWEADMVAAGAKHLGDECWEWDVQDFEFRLWQQAIGRARTSIGMPGIELIAQQWDGCEYDAPGGSIDIGEAIRTAAKRLESREALDAARLSAHRSEGGT